MSLRMAWRAALAGLGGLAAPAAALAQQALDPLPIERVLEDQDGDLIPDRLGDVVRVSGLVTWSAHDTYGPWRYGVIQDSMAAVGIVSADSALLGNHVGVGTRVEVEGHVRQYRGGERIEIQRIRILGPGLAPEPLTVRVEDLQGERYSNRLVTITGRLKARAELDDRIFYLRDRTGEIRLRIPWTFFQDPAFVDRFLLGRVRITGIAAQSKAEPPFDSGYLLAPRDPADVEFLPPSPIRRLAIWVAAALLLISWVVVLLSLLRRRADRKAYQRRLEQSEHRFRQLFENANDALFLHDCEGTVVDVNRRACGSLGCAREELVGRRMPSDEHGILSASRIAELWHRLHPGEVVTLEGVHRKKDGSTFPVEARASKFELGNRSLVLVDVRDLTERRRLELQLLQTTRLEAVGRLAGGVAHDFNNVLTAIRGYAEMLLEEIGESERARADLVEIKGAADRASSLTRQLLAFSRQQVLQPRVLDLNAVVRDIEKMLRRLIGEDLTFLVGLAPELGRVKADPGQIEQVILNLVVNARDAMPKGGRITVETQNFRLDESELWHFAFPIKPGEYVMLCVNDTGVGMSPEVHERVFEPFFTTKEKGTGLGLSTVYGIVKQSGGHIWAETEVGRGSAIRLILPRIEGVAATSRNPPADPPESLQGSETVLVAEDEAAVRTIIHRVLHANGYTVLEAANGREALETGTSYGGSIDLLIADLVMPEMGGRELVGRLAGLRPGIQTLLISGYTEEARLRPEVLDADMPFLQKPFSPAELVRKVREVLGPAVAGASQA